MKKLIQLKEQYNSVNSKLLKSVYTDLSNPDNVKSTIKLKKRLEQYNDNYKESDDSPLLCMYDDELLKTEFMSNTISQLGLPEIDYTDYDTSAEVHQLNTRFKREQEEIEAKEDTDQLTELPTSQILISSMKSSSSSSCSDKKSISFSNDTRCGEDD